MPYRVLCVARNYPNPVLERLGLWTERLVKACTGGAEFEVIAPVPYFPPLPGLPQYARYRRVPRQELRNGIDVYHPRFLTGAGYWLHPLEWWPFHAAIRPLADRLHRAKPFDLIHAHFVYPDGYAAARLAKRYGIPLIITEQADWRNWMTRYPQVRRRAVEAATASRFVVAVSHSLRRSIVEFTGAQANVIVIPNTVDVGVFAVDPKATPPPDRLLFVGIMRHVKGLDLLLRAFRLLLDRGRHLRLAVVGESFYQSYQKDHEELQRLVHELNLNSSVDFLGGMPPELVAKEMRASTMLVLPSRREALPAVLLEALACGLPVVATRCGGPEDIVTPEVGVLVEPESPEALTQGIEQVLARRAEFAPTALHTYVANKYGLEAVGNQLLHTYEAAVRDKAATSARLSQPDIP